MRRLARLLSRNGHLLRSEDPPVWPLQCTVTFSLLCCVHQTTSATDVLNAASQSLVVSGDSRDRMCCVLLLVTAVVRTCMCIQLLSAHVVSSHQHSSDLAQQTLPTFAAANVQTCMVLLVQDIPIDLGCLQGEQVAIPPPNMLTPPLLSALPASHLLQYQGLTT